MRRPLVRPDWRSFLVLRPGLHFRFELRPNRTINILELLPARVDENGSFFSPMTRNLSKKVNTRPYRLAANSHFQTWIGAKWRASKKTCLPPRSSWCCQPKPHRTSHWPAHGQTLNSYRLVASPTPFPAEAAIFRRPSLEIPSVVRLRRMPGPRWRWHRPLQRCSIIESGRRGAIVQ